MKKQVQATQLGYFAFAHHSLQETADTATCAPQHAAAEHTAQHTVTQYSTEDAAQAAVTHGTGYAAQHATAQKAGERTIFRRLFQKNTGQRADGGHCPNC